MNEDSSSGARGVPGVSSGDFPLAEDGLPLPRRSWAVATISVSIAMAVLDTAIANVALPTIATDLSATPADAIWVVNAYQLSLIVALLPLSSLGDIKGYRQVYQVGLAVFTLASLLCALSDSLLTLTLARMLQGLGAAGIMSVNTALVRFIYPRHRLGHGMGINTVVVAISSAMGPSLASAILSMGAWQWLFAINVPLGALALAIAWRSLPTTPKASHPFDSRSAILSALTFGLLMSGVDGIGHRQPIMMIIAELGVALGAGIWLVRRQLALTSPLLPLDLLRIPLFALSAATSVCSFTAQTLAMVALPFYFQDVLGRTQVETGVLMTPWPLAVAIVAPLSGRLAERVSPGWLGGGGMALMCLGLLATGFMPTHPDAWQIGWRMMLCGVGFGLFQAPNNRAMIGAAPRSRTGGASGMLSTSRLLGQTTGAALVALIFGNMVHGGTVAALAVGAAFAALASGVSLFRVAQS